VKAARLPELETSQGGNRTHQSPVWHRLFSAR